MCLFVGVLGGVGKRVVTGEVVLRVGIGFHELCLWMGWVRGFWGGFEGGEGCLLSGYGILCTVFVGGVEFAEMLI